MQTPPHTHTHTHTHTQQPPLSQPAPHGPSKAAAKKPLSKRATQTPGEGRGVSAAVSREERGHKYKSVAKSGAEVRSITLNRSERSREGGWEGKEVGGEAGIYRMPAPIPPPMPWRRLASWGYFSWTSSCVRVASA